MEKIEIVERASEDRERCESKESEALLNHCALSVKEAIDSFSQMLPMLTDEELQQLSCRYRALYEKSAERCLFFLKKQEEGQQAQAFSQSSSWLSTQVKLAFRSDNRTLAAHLFDGCHKMIRDLYASLHRLKNADAESRRIAHRLIGTAEDFRDELKEFL